MSSEEAGPTPSRGPDDSVDVTPKDLTRSIELVRRAQGDDREAVNRLFERYYERVRSIIRMRMGSRIRSYVDSGDILQETFLGALRGFDKFEVRDEKSLIHWLARIAENQIRAAAEYHHAQKRDRRRDQALEHVRSSISSGTLRLDPVAMAPDIVDALGAREDLDEVLSCAEDLPDEQREVLSLRLLEYGDNSWDQIAEALDGISPDAARMRYGRAIAALLRVRRQRRGE